jgi:hypothetical protein
VRRRSDESLGRDEHLEFVQPTFGHSALACLKRWSREDLILLSSVSSLITRLQLRLESVQQNPQQPVAAVEAQATRRVLLQNRELVTERGDLRLQATRTRKLEASSAKRATKSELIVVATMISRMIGTSAFSEFSVTTGSRHMRESRHAYLQKTAPPTTDGVFVRDRDTCPVCGCRLEFNVPDQEQNAAKRGALWTASWQ